MAAMHLAVGTETGSELGRSAHEEEEESLKLESPRAAGGAAGGRTAGMRKEQGGNRGTIDGIPSCTRRRLRVD